MLTTRPLRRTPALLRPAASDPIGNDIPPLRDTRASRSQLAQSEIRRRTPHPLSSDVPNILHVGCGSRSPGRLHDFFQTSRRGTKSVVISTPIINRISLRRSPICVGGSMMQAMMPYGLRTSSNTSRATKCHWRSPEFVRVLSPAGFALIRSPDIEVVAQFIVDGRINDVIYTSSAGPITPLDMIYGHGASIAQKKLAMRHGTAFTQELLGSDLLAAGFDEVRTTRTRTYEVWAVAFMSEADVDGVLEETRANRNRFSQLEHKSSCSDGVGSKAKVGALNINRTHAEFGIRRLPPRNNRAADGGGHVRLNLCLCEHTIVDA